MKILAGKIINYYKRIGVASIKVDDYLEVGNLIRIKGRTTNFDQKIESLQIKHVQVTSASKGEVAGLKVDDFVRVHDCIYRVEPKLDKLEKPKSEYRNPKQIQNSNNLNSKTF